MLRPGLTRASYVDPTVFERERRALGRAAYVYVGHEAELRRPGSYVAVEPWGERLVVVRGQDLVLRAFVDLCAHRGLPLTLGASGVLPREGLVCPYHGLAYGDDGRVRRHLPALTALRLSERPVAERWGQVFVGLSEGAANFDAFAKGAPPWLDGTTHGSFRLRHRRRFVTRANWKLVVENFQESWHFPRVHRGLDKLTPHGLTTSKKLGRNWFGGTMRFAKGEETVSRSGKRSARPFVAGAAFRKHVYDAFMFPLWLTSLQPDYFLVYRLMPLSVDATEVQADIFGHAADKVDDFSDVSDFWDQTNDEDRVIVERQMSGVRSPAFDRMHLVTSEEQGLIAFAKRYQTTLRGRAT